MKSIGGILLAVVILLAMVTIHEFGHYVAGKLLGFRINEFAVGFGPAILKKRSKKTGELFALRCIPLGGYCAFDGEDELDEEEEKKEENARAKPQENGEEEPFPEMTLSEEMEEKEGGRYEVNSQTPAKTEEEGTQPSQALSKEGHETEEYPQPKGERFNDQPPWKRIIVLLAGAFMNYLLALVLLLIMVGSYGMPMCIAVPIDFEGSTAPSVAWETEYLSEGDILLEMNGKAIGMYTDCIDALKGKKAGEEVPVKVSRIRDKQKRTREEKTVKLVLKMDAATIKNMADTDGLANVMDLEIRSTLMKKGFWGTIGGAFRYSGEMGTSVLRSLGELLTGKLGIDAVGGPVTTITTTAQVVTVSPYSFLYMASFIGVNLAVFNLLPIPALDGCKVIFCLIEWIRKKPVNRKVETIIHFAGILLLFGFAILVDLLQLFA